MAAQTGSGSQVAVVGSGYWGKNLVRNYHRLGALRLICDRDETLLANFKEQYPGVETCLVLSEVLSRDDIQGVVIATPAETHYTLARESLLAGKHVYVEKPLVIEEEKGVELVELAKKKGLILMVGHLLQYHPAFVRLKELALSGELGRINYIYSNRLNLGKIRREENILWSFAPHDISMILTLAGEEPETVMATGGNYLHPKIADVTTTHLEFPSGLKAHIFVSWLHPFKEQKLVVVGDQKMAVFDDTLPWPDKLLLYPHRITWEGPAPVPAKAEPERLDIPEAEPLRLECEHFLHSMAAGDTPLTDGREGLRVLKVLNAAQRSLDETRGKAAVKETGEPDYFVHPNAVIDRNVTIGQGVKIWHFSHVLSGSDIGPGCKIGQNVVIGPDVSVGKGCKIQNNVSVYKGVTLEDNVFCGPAVVFTNVFNPRCHIPRMGELRKTLVREGATLGANCTIVCGTNLGRFCFVGAGAVVTRDVPDHALVTGNPARRTGWVCACGETLGKDLTCPACNAAYHEVKGRGLSKKRK
ncbi:MAG: Gfo/Idh/MocA family oxidoreductase [Thermodesulfobacteriota bacterium]|nr:Gfo/Idh/MocA family oxidoreductase [Thermodesulfobacteriota bacterium]